MYSLLLRSDFLFFFSKNARRQRQLLKILHGFTDKTILLRRKKLLEVSALKNVGQLTDDELGVKKKMAFLDVLLQSTIDGKPLTNMDIREEVDTFVSFLTEFLNFQRTEI